MEYATFDGTAESMFCIMLWYTTPQNYYFSDIADYVESSGRLTFESGSVAGDVECVDIGIIDDDCKEDNETFAFALCAGGDPSIHLGDFDADVYIIDNEGIIFPKVYHAHQYFAKLNFPLTLIYIYIYFLFFQS